MINWRQPILKLYDSRITHNPIPGFVAFLNNYQDLPAEHRQQIQAEQVAKLLRHVAKNVPFYRDTVLKHGVVRGDQVDLARFTQLPELTRDDMHSEFERLRSDDFETRSWYRNASGGSSGIPVKILQDQYYQDMGRASQEVQYNWAGRKTGEPVVTLWGSERDVLLGTVGWRNKLTNFIRNRVVLNSWDMNQERLRRYVDTIQRVRPVMIEAYAESVYELARLINDAGIQINGVRGVITSAGTLYPFIREEVERAFHCPVLNRYGSREVGAFALERASGAGLEVMSYSHLVEVVDERSKPCGPGEEGDVLVTCLTNYTMPIIRYRIGDRAVVGATAFTPIPSVERLQTVTGRIMDTFVREDGTTVPGNFFMHFLGTIHNRGWLKKAQVIQQDYNKILIKLITESHPPLETLEEIRRSFKKAMGACCDIDFEFVDTIPPLASGKYRYVVSLVQHPRLAKAYPLSSAPECHRIAS
jgi:phenylacetate-CoA ligase